MTARWVMQGYGSRAWATRHAAKLRAHKHRTELNKVFAPDGSAYYAVWSWVEKAEASAHTEKATEAGHE